MGKKEEDAAAAAANEQLVATVRAVCDARLKDPQRAERQRLKDLINGPINFLLGQAIGADETYSQQMGMISRSYRGSGAYPNTDFDMHLPLAPPPAARIDFEQHKLPACNVAINGGAPKAWADCVQNGRLSGTKVREALRKRIGQCAADWNKANTEHGTMALAEGKMNAPICVAFTPAASEGDASPKAVGVSITPVVFAKSVKGADALFDKITGNKTWQWPPAADLDFRRHLAEQAVLLPRGDGWQASMMVAHKLLVGELDDQGNTYKEMLYRALKTTSKKLVAAPGNDYQESVKIASYALLQVYLSLLGKHSDPSDWTDPKSMPERLKSVLADWRNALASAELREHGGQAAANALAAYKGSSYLNPTLGKMVRNIEALQKNPQGIERAAK